VECSRSRSVRLAVAAACTLAGCRCASSTPPPSDTVITVDAPSHTEPDVLADKQDMPAAIAVDSTHVYWANAGKAAVRRVPKAGGAIETLWESADTGAYALALDATHAYFGTVGGIGRVPKAGGAADTLETGDWPKWIAVDADAVYFQTDARVGRVPKGGDAGIAAGLGGGGEIGGAAIDDGFLYWVQQDGVRRVPKKGGPTELLARGTFRFTKLALGPADVFWGDALLEAIFAVPKAGGPVRFVAHAWNIAGRELVTEGADLFVVGSSGSITRVDLATGHVFSVASGLDRGGDADHRMAIAVDGARLIVAAGGYSIRGARPVIIDLTGRGDGGLPDFDFGGQILRIPRVPADATEENQGGPVQIGMVWFDGTTMQDSGNATRWIDAMPDDVLAAIRGGHVRVRLIAEVGGQVDDAFARTRAQVVQDAIVPKLGGTPRIEVGTAPPRGYHGDVQVALDPDDVGTLLTPPPSKPGP
jgi:hypothetical protein